jgi:hypothetical protein
VIPSINQGADFGSCISVYMKKRKRGNDVLGRDVSIPISHSNLDLFSLGGAFEMFNLMTLLLTVLHIGVYSLYWFYLWHCVSSVASGMTRQGGRSWLGIYPSPDHQMALHWDLRIMLLFRRPTTFPSRWRWRGVHNLALRRKGVGCRKPVKTGQETSGVDSAQKIPS